MTVRVHVKNNHARAGGFPATPESEPVFTITRRRWEAALAAHGDLAGRLEAFIDWDEDNFTRSMATAEALVAWDLPTADLARIAPRLKWIHIIGAGVEHLCPMDWVPPGVVVTNNKGAQAAKAGEFAAMAILMLHCRIPAIAGNQVRRRWLSLYATPIAGRTVLVIGTGSLGGAAAERLAKLGLRVLGISRHGRPHPHIERMATPAALDEFLPQADYVFVCVPSTPETQQLLDRRRLRRMKAGAGIVNIGRASAIDYRALAALLEEGHLSGAILDVFDPEPLPASSPLWQVPNLMVLPHVSADDGESYVETTLGIVFDNMRRFLAGAELRNIVRPELGY